MRFIKFLFITNLLKISYGFSKPMLEQQEVRPIEARPTAKPLTIRFHTPVTSDSCSKLAEALVQMDMQSKQLEASFGQRMPVKLHLQSLGGELLPTFYICDLIKELDTPVHVYIDGFVASAASLMAICGEKRFMTKNSCILVHQLRAASAGKLSDMKQEMDNLNNFMGSLRQIYLENSNVKEEELDDLLTSEFWLDSQKCLELGFVDEIIGC